MKKYYPLICMMLVFVLAEIVISCEHDYGNDVYIPVSPVEMDLTKVPYPVLSDYHFFEGVLKDLKPSYKVLPYRPASELFTDYAHKKRFVWMPAGAQAHFDGDDNALIFPVGAVLIKNFYYEHVQPSNEMRIIETRLLIKTHEAVIDDSGNESDSGWQPYDYIWNEAQTEATLDTEGQGSFGPLTFTDQALPMKPIIKFPQIQNVAPATN